MLKAIRTLLDILFVKMTAATLPAPPWDHLYEIPLQELVERAEGGDGKAAFVLGDIFDQGQNGVTRDRAVALKWYRHAESLGDGDALNNLGSMHHHGEGLPQDLVAARHYYEQAAAAGCGAAMGNLGRMYRQGEAGLAVDHRLSQRWLKKAARLNDGNAMVMLGYAYGNGIGTTRSPLRALYWYRKAAQAMNLSGLFNLGQAYWFGDHVIRDRQKAVRLYRQAAHSDHVGSAFMLGEAYAAGDGIGKDPEAALRYLRQAEADGHGLAQESIEELLAAHPQLNAPSEACDASAMRTDDVSADEDSGADYALARQAEAAGQWQTAIDHYQRMIPRIDADPAMSEDQRCGVRERLAFCLHEAECYAEARTINEEILARGETLFGPESDKLLVVIANLSQNAYCLGDLATARTLLERHLSLASRHRDTSCVDASLFQLGVLSFEQGQAQEAKRFMKHRLSLAEESADPERIADAEADLRILYEKLGR